MVPQNITTASNPVSLLAGFDTHKDTHTVAAATTQGQDVEEFEFPATLIGYNKMLKRIQAHGKLVQVAIECTNNYGKTLADFLTSQGILVTEVYTTDKGMRRRVGKTDISDAHSALDSILFGYSKGQAKQLTGVFFDLSVMVTARNSAVRQRTETTNCIKALLVRCPDHVKAKYPQKDNKARFTAISHARPSATCPDRLVLITLKQMAKRWLTLDEEADMYEDMMKQIVSADFEELISITGISYVAAAALLVRAGSNFSRIRSPEAFVRLAGCGPKPLSSGKSNTMILDRGGDRQLNNILYMIIVSRMGFDEETKAFVKQLEDKHKSKKAIIRILKRYLARRLYKVLSEIILRYNTNLLAL